MINKKNKFLTFCFSMIPGGGQMFMGFMKEGISLLSAFTFVIFIGSSLRISPLMLILPVIWIYSFFDSLNKMYLSEELFEKLDDQYLFQFDKLPKINPALFYKNKTIVAFLLIFLGLNFLWNNIIDIFYIILPDRFMYSVLSIIGNTPEIVLGFLIIYLGIKLIKGKKEELLEIQDQNEEV